MKTLIRIFAIVPVVLFLVAAYCVFFAPPEPAFNAPDKEAVIARLNHLFTVAAYSIVWAIQLGYLAWLGLRNIALKEEAARSIR
jgi:phage shock protein PspC (stress-responsive transcriptional regulator)